MTLSHNNENPWNEFKKKLEEFAKGHKRGIRNPFVIVPVEPTYESKACQKLIDWAGIEKDLKIETFSLKNLFPKTTVFNLVISSEKYQERKLIEETLKNNLNIELIELISTELDKKNEIDILLLLHLGSLYPFTRASELLDELDRRKVKKTIGLPFPGHVIGEKLSFFGEDANQYYPAHVIKKKVGKRELQ